MLDTAFDGAVPTPPTPPGTELLTNAGFENGMTGWSGTVSAIGEYADVDAHSGQRFCWLAGYGRTKTEPLAQTVNIPIMATSIRLRFWVDISTEEATATKAFDKCVVQVRSSSG